MSFRITGDVRNPNDVIVRISFDATIGELVELRKQMDANRWPSSDFCRGVQELINHACAHFGVEVEP